MWGAAHILLSTGNHNVGFTALDSLRRQMQRLQARATNIVNGDGGNGVGESSVNGRLACRILPRTSREDLTQDHFINRVNIHPGAFH
ncbi:hypothetical protein D3C73_1199900 [compost metagenome]